MIIVWLIGGLGNQMFQYAIARNLSFINKTEFKLDITDFPKYKSRKYELGNFNIIENFATKEDLSNIKERKKKFSSYYDYFSEKILKKTYYHKYKEKKDFQFDPNVFELKGNIYLMGYWQTEKYFENIKQFIKKDFMIKTEPSKKNKEAIDEIINCNAIALHVRRGDYVSNPEANSFHGICSLEYYKNAIAIITKRVNNPHFFVFSDDSTWASENIKTTFPTSYITHNDPDKGYEDLRLMQKCKHFIIANSSFSWWGAWLSDNPEKIVIAPKEWVKKEGLAVKDLIPQEWIKI